MVRLMQTARKRSYSRFASIAAAQIIMNAETSNSRKRRNLSTSERRHKTWASLIPDLLIQILMRLDFINLIACAGVCKEWRSIINDYRPTLLQNQTPLAVVISKYAKNGCFLHNIFDGTRYKTLLPILAPRGLVGLSCGYLIMMFSNKFSLVNLFTRHEIHFPKLPKHRKSQTQAILFYSEKVSENLLLVLNRKLQIVMLSLSSTPKWHMVKVGFVALVDIAYFNGCILALTSDARIGRLKIQYQTLNTNCSTLKQGHQNLHILNVRINIPASLLTPLHLVPSSDHLFMVSYVRGENSPAVTMVHKLDWTLMEWIQVNDLGEDAIFLSEGSCAILNRSKWGGCSNGIYTLMKSRNNEWHMNLLNTSSSSSSSFSLQKGSNMQPHYWYFPHQFNDKNIINCQEEEAVDL